MSHVTAGTVKEGGEHSLPADPFAPVKTMDLITKEPQSRNKKLHVTYAMVPFAASLEHSGRAARLPSWSPRWRWCPGHSHPCHSHCRPQGAFGAVSVIPAVGPHQFETSSSSCHSFSGCACAGYALNDAALSQPCRGVNCITCVLRKHQPIWVNLVMLPSPTMPFVSTDLRFRRITLSRKSNFKTCNATSVKINSSKLCRNE